MTTAIGSSSVSSAVAVQSDSKVVVAGWSPNTAGILHFTIARYNQDGSLDSTFGSGGVAVIPLSTNTKSGPDYGDGAYAVAIQPDGKILAAGYDASSPFQYKKQLEFYDDWALVRLNSNGTLDTTFGGGTGYVTTRLAPATIQAGPFGGGATSIALQPSDGKIVVAGAMQVDGYSATYGGVAVVRYNTDGSLDSTFGVGGEVVDAKNGALGSADEYVAVDGSGRIDVAGYSPETPTFVKRYTPNGTLDSTFGKGGVVKATGEPNGIGLQSTGKIVVYGIDGATLGRFNTNGSVDTNFGTNGFYTDSRISGDGAMVIQPADDEIVCTATPYPNFVVTRVLANGSSYDPAFGTNGLSTSLSGTSAICSVSLDPNGSILATGGFYVAGASGFETARFLGNSSSGMSAIDTTSTTSMTNPPDTVLVSLVLDDAPFLDSLTSSKHRRSS